MKSDLPTLMQARNLDALIVIGNAFHNPPMVYFTGVSQVSEALLVIKRGQAPLLFCHTMERENAAATGLATRSITDYNYKEIFEQSGNDPLRAQARLMQLMLTDAGVTSGRVGFYGQYDAGESFGVLRGLEELLPNVELVGEGKNSLIRLARATKDEAELVRMKAIAKTTTDVVAMVADYLSQQREKDGVVVDKDGQPVTVGGVKSKISLWMAERGAEQPHGVIFAPGAEGGVPHNVGKNETVLRTGEPIVFDIFPAEPGGGYYADFTRTWCIGHASEAAQKLYDDVKYVYDTIVGDLKVDTEFKQYQDLTCDLFEERGHPTVRTDRTTKVGYVHALAHGLGLDIHESPSSGRDSTAEDILRVGSVVTIEPGLYYPERGLGMRIEDAVVMRPNGKPEVLAPYPYDLVLPLKSQR